MDKEQRKQDIIDSFKYCSHDLFYKDDVISELLGFQKEMVEMVFGKDYPGIDYLRIEDVRKRLNDKNKEHGGIATTQLKSFNVDCKRLSNQIKSAICGVKGEESASRRLKEAFGENGYGILRNVELSNDDRNTELDVIVVKPSCIVIVEVKNPQKNIFISRDGGYYYSGKYNGFDCNILRKMNLREELLNKLLEDKGFYGVPIRSLLVFMNNGIEFINECKEISACFSPQLPYIVEEFEGHSELSVEEIVEVIKSGSNKKPYPLDFDATEFKEHFAEVVATLEFSSTLQEESAENSRVGKTELKKKPIEGFSLIGYIKKHPVKSVLATLGTIAVASGTIVITKIKKK